MKQGSKDNKGKKSDGNKAASKPSSVEGDAKGAAQAKGKKTQASSSSAKVDKAPAKAKSKSPVSAKENPVVEVVAEPIPEVVAKPEVKSVSEPVVEAVAEPEVKAIAEQEVKAIAEPIVESPAEEAAGTKRKVAKTLLFNPASVLEAAAAANQSASLEAPAAKSSAQAEPALPSAAGATTVEATTVEPTTVESTAVEATAVETTVEATKEPQPKRKVPKTLLFDTASVTAAAAAAQEQAKQAVAETAEAATPAAHEAIAETPTAAQVDLNQASNAEPPKAEQSNRKVAKTLLFDPSEVIKAASPAPPQETQGPAQDSPAPQEPAPRKVSKTLLYDPVKVLEAANAAAQEQQNTPVQEQQAAPGPEQPAVAEHPAVAEQAPPEEPKRKVAKTILFDYSGVAEAASAANNEQQATAAPAQKSAPAEPKRKVAKTILFDYAHVVEAAHAAAQEQAVAAREQEVARKQEVAREQEVAAQEQQPAQAVPQTAAEAPTVQPTPELPAEPASHLRPARIPAPADDDAPPDLNIDAPPVRLFFEKPLPEVALEVPEPGPDAHAVEPLPDQTTAPVIEDPPPTLNTSTPAATEQPKRRVPRTLLFNPIIAADGSEMDPGPADSAVPAGADGANEQNFAPDSTTPRRISTKRIAKTLLYNATADLAAGNRSTSKDEAGPDQSTAEPPLDETEAEQVVERYIARTMLDHSILFAELARTHAKQEEKAIEVAKEKAAEPFKPFFPIECNKMALPCTWTWDDTYSTEKYRYCGQCQRPVYNFTGLEIADAEEIILKAENCSKFTLYKRTDGKFMTGDCPMAVKRKSDMILMSVGGVLLTFCLVIYMIFMPKHKPAPAPAAVTSTTSEPTGTVRKHMPGPAAIKSAPGVAGHYVAGKGIIMEPATAPTPPVQAPATTTSTGDENPDWQFSKP